MSDMEISIPFTRFSASNGQISKLVSVKNNNSNNNNINIRENFAEAHNVKLSEINSRVVSPRSMTANGEPIPMPGASISQRSVAERRTPPFHLAPMSPPRSTHSLSPSSASSPRTMSPPTDHRLPAVYSNDGYQPNYIGSVPSYQTSMPPKKSFCIDALLSKNGQSAGANAGQHSPETIRYLSEEDMAQKYGDDNREYASSPDEINSR